MTHGSKTQGGMTEISTTQFSTRIDLEITKLNDKYLYQFLEGQSAFD